MGAPFQLEAVPMFLQPTSVDEILHRWRKQASWFGPIFLVLIVTTGASLLYYVLFQA